MTTSWCKHCNQKTPDRPAPHLCSSCYLPKGQTQSCTVCGNCKTCGEFKDAERIGFEIGNIELVIG